MRHHRARDSSAPARLKPGYQWPKTAPSVVGMTKPLDLTQTFFALVQRGANAQEEGGTLAQYQEAVRHPLDKVRNRDDLLDVIAFLTAQLVGARARLDADESLALANIESTIKNFRERQARATKAQASADAIAPITAKENDDVRGN